MSDSGQGVSSLARDAFGKVTRIVLSRQDEGEGETTQPANVSTPATVSGTEETGDIEDYGPQLMLAIWLLATLALTVMSLRLYCKISRHRRLWWDDHVLIVSWCSLGVAATMTSVSVAFGYGRQLRESEMTLEDTLTLQYVANVAGFFSILAALWSKTSFAITLSRISEGWILRFIWFIIISMNLIMGASAAMVWIPMDLDARIRYYMFSTAYSGAMDITLSIFPWKIIWTLNMNRKEKIGVLLAMSMGVLAGATSIFKIPKIETLHSNSTVDSVGLVILGIAETAVTIVAASIPILRALIRENRPRPLPEDFNELKTLEGIHKSSSSRARLFP